eukprot:TRINITY_DN1187_c13_g1_i1.p1 TRINITY_DN1187_c13_g1~~TRINITY_DN1187_c13_g1_i1.p1  ORF type:complete len:584 (+),score=220.24 TRINITY_DN1187_c13_g1_i1:66-1754(+)
MPTAEEEALWDAIAAKKRAKRERREAAEKAKQEGGEAAWQDGAWSGGSWNQQSWSQESWQKDSWSSAKAPAKKEQKKPVPPAVTGKPPRKDSKDETKATPVRKRSKDAPEGLAEDEEEVVENKAPKKKRKASADGEAVAKKGSSAGASKRREAAEKALAAARQALEAAQAMFTNAAQEDSDEEEEAPEQEEEVKPKKPKKAKKPVVEEEEEEEDEEATVEPPRPKTKKARKQSMDADEEETPEASEPPAKKRKASAGVAEEMVDEGQSKEESLTVFVGGIPWSVEQDLLKKDFEVCGEVTDMYMPQRDGLPRGFAFVTFKTEAGLQEALKYDNEEYGGRRLQVYRAEARGQKGAGKGGEEKEASRENEVFVRGLAWLPLETEEAVVRSLFADCGKILRLNLAASAEKRCRGFGWLTFKSGAAVEKALLLNGKNHDGRSLVVEKSGQHKTADGEAKIGVGGGATASGTSLEVFVKNLSFDMTEKVLRKKFSECGTIERMKIPMVGGGKSMGFAWITFTDQDGLDAALALNDAEYEGRRLFVEKSGQHKDKGKGKGKGKGKSKK